MVFHRPNIFPSRCICLSDGEGVRRGRLGLDATAMEWRNWYYMICFQVPGWIVLRWNHKKWWGWGEKRFRIECVSPWVCSDRDKHSILYFDLISNCIMIRHVFPFVESSFVSVVAFWCRPQLTDWLTAWWTEGLGLSQLQREPTETEMLTHIPLRILRSTECQTVLQSANWMEKLWKCRQKLSIWRWTFWGWRWWMICRKSLKLA